MVSLPEEENTPEKRVNKIFDLMDKVRNIFMAFTQDDILPPPEKCPNKIYIFDLMAKLRNIGLLWPNHRYYIYYNRVIMYWKKALH